MQKVQQLKEENFAAVREFYWELIDEMYGSPFLPGWQKGIYPSDELLRAALSHGELYVLKRGDRIAASMILNHACNEGYQGTDWAVEADEQEVLVIHALGVLPAFQRQGLAENLVCEAVRLALETGGKALRLDVLDGNLPAVALYEGLGFRFRRKVCMFYEDTGWTDYLLYEKVL